MTDTSSVSQNTKDWYEPSQEKMDEFYLKALSEALEFYKDRPSGTIPMRDRVEFYIDYRLDNYRIGYKYGRKYGSGRYYELAKILTNENRMGEFFDALDALDEDDDNELINALFDEFGLRD